MIRRTIVVLARVLAALVLLVAVMFFAALWLMPLAGAL